MVVVVVVGALLEFSLVIPRSRILIEHEQLPLPVAVAVKRTGTLSGEELEVLRDILFVSVDFKFVDVKFIAKLEMILCRFAFVLILI